MLAAVRRPSAWRRLITALSELLRNAKRMASRQSIDKGNFCLTRLAYPPRQPQHEDQHFGDRLVEVGRNFVADLAMGQGPRQHLVLLDRDVMFPGEFDDPGADDALALGDDARRAG